MESLSPQVVSAAKLPILNPNEFDLWKMRIEQVIEGVVQPVASTTAEQRLARKNELKAHGTLLMALPDKHQLKFNIHKDAKTLMEAIEKRFGGNKKTKKRNKTDLEEQSLDDLFNNLMIYKDEVKSSSSASTSTQNIAFVSSSNTDSTNEPISATASVYAVSTKIPIAALPNIDADDLEEMDLKWQMAMLTDFICPRWSATTATGKDTLQGSVGLELVEARLLVYQQNESVFKEDIKLLKLEVKLRDNALVVLRQNLKKAEQERDDLKLKLEKFQISSKNLRTFMPSKPDLVFHTPPNTDETVHTAFNVEPIPTNPDKDLSPTHKPLAHIIEEWVSDSEDDSETQILQNTAIPKPKSQGNNRNRKACFVCKSLTYLIKDCNPQHALKDTGVIDSRCSRYMIGNMSYLSNFKAINGGYVACGGNPKGGKILEKNRVLVTKPQNNTPYDLLHGKTLSIGFMRPFSCLVTILNTLDPLGNQSNPSAGVQEQFATEKAREKNVQQYVLFLVWYSGSKNPQNTDGDAAFEEKELEFERRKLEFKVHVSSSSSAQLKKHDDKTKREAKGKSPVGSSTGYRNLSTKFKDFSDNSIKKDNVAGSLVLAVGQISTNSTNTFSAAGPFNVAVSPTHGKSLYVDSSQLLDDPNMPELDAITYSDNEDDVGAEADFTNLETTITEELLQFKMQKVWVLVDFLNRKRAIGTKWVFRNKKDERGIVVRNKGLLFVQGHTQEEGIDYEEVFALVARIEAIRLFLAYASFMGFMVYQMDVKSAFLYGTIKEEVYVCQPLGFEDSDYPDKVYKVVKALYGLHQALRAWYKTLANYLLENGFQRGKIDQTLFIKRQKGNILLVKIYVDDIIFGSTNKDLCKPFEKLMKDKLQISSMSELTFFLGLQVKQKPYGRFIGQFKYVAKILRKFGLRDGKSASTPTDTENPFLKDPDGEDVDVHTYRSMIGSLIYLTSSRLDIMFAVYACAHFQVTLKVSHLHAVKRIFRYLKGKPHLGLWYPKNSPFNLVAYSDSDYAGASLDRKSTTEGCQFFGCRLISWQCKKQTVVATSSTKAEYIAATMGINCLPNEEIFTELSRMRYKKPSTKLTFYKAFLSSQWKFLIHTILQCMSAKRTSWNEFSSSMASAPKGIFKHEKGRKRVFWSRNTLFEGMIVAHQVGEAAAEVNVEEVSAAGVAAKGAASVVDDDVPTAVEEPSIPSPTPPTQPPPPSQDLPSTS
uniref:Putative ribonuclease H-like domain-containing protein n=1 Tax=Tanacetum cinerariifolium TaxID=118510 RepID=A0A6L2KSC4_TANCI|nr:putative ribonuclease H-like domain-containing protein [Tanacetum cinerariifolium]GEU90929.1 putative ribonuclease H-like domain-containing protein [Tanacetum cinerariifolium]